MIHPKSNGTRGLSLKFRSIVPHVFLLLPFILLIFQYVPTFSFGMPFQREVIKTLPSEESIFRNYYINPFSSLLHFNQMDPHIGGRFTYSIYNQTRYNYRQLMFSPFASIYSASIQADLSTTQDKDEGIKSEEWYAREYLIAGMLSQVTLGDPREDRFSTYIGPIRDFSLGHGTLVSKYSNQAYYPLVKLSGSIVNLDLHYLGITGFTNDIGTFDLIGLRSFARPLKALRTGKRYFDWVLSDMEIGYSFVHDRAATRVYGLKNEYNENNRITRFTLDNKYLDFSDAPDFREKKIIPAGTEINGVTSDKDVTVEQDRELSYLPKEIFAWGIDWELPLFKHPRYFTFTVYGAYNTIFQKWDNNRPHGVVDTHKDGWHYGMLMRVIPRSLDLDVTLEFNHVKKSYDTRFFHNSYDFYKALHYEEMIHHYTKEMQQDTPEYLDGWYLEIGKTLSITKKRLFRIFFAYEEDKKSKGGPEIRVGFIAKDAVPRLSLLLYFDQYNLDIKHHAKEPFLQDDLNSMVYAEFQFRITSNVEIALNFYKGFQYRQEDPDSKKYKLEKLETTSVIFRLHYDYFTSLINDLIRRRIEKKTGANFVYIL